VSSQRLLHLLALILAGLAFGSCNRGSKSSAPAASASASASNDTDPLAALRLNGPPVDWSRPLPVTPPGGLAEPGYVGSEACKECHPSIYRSYERHSMARTGLRPLTTLDGKWLARIFDAGASQRVLQERTGYSYRPFRTGNDYFVEEFVAAPDGSRVQRWVQKLDYAYSAGSYGMTFYFRQGNRYYQLPIDYYAGAERWGLDPAASKYNPRFSKALGAFCISCHADYPKRQAGTDEVFVEPPPTGVGCERCHGPGQKHAASLLPADIVNPANLPSARQLDVCTQCHESSFSGLRADRDEFSYRPGQPLDAYRVNFVADPSEPDRLILLGHPERMVRSACWRGSGGKLSCTSCHDPHKSSFEQPATWWDARCNDCHRDHPCTESASARAAQGGHCVPCHMRSGPPTSPTLVTITDHWIQRRPSPIRPGSDDPKHLVSWADLVKDLAPGDDVVALEAVAYVHAGQRAEAETRVLRVGDESLHVPGLYEMLAGHYEGAKQPSNEARAYSTLLAFAPDDQGGLYGYAHVMMQRGPDGAAEATQALDRMLALDADDPSALEAKAELLVRSGRTDDARPLFARAASVSPMAGASHVALAVLAARDKRDADSIAELEAARRIEPGDAWILGHLHDAYARSGDAARIAEIEHAQAFFSSRQGQAPTSATEWLPDGWR
jgi:hypothetical protein